MVFVVVLARRSRRRRYSRDDHEPVKGQKHRCFHG